MNAFEKGPITDEDKQLTDDYDKYRKDIESTYIPPKESKFEKLFEYLFYAWFIIGPPLLLFLLYYFRKYYKKHIYIYSFISLLVLLYIMFHYGSFLILMFGL